MSSDPNAEGARPSDRDPTVDAADAVDHVQAALLELIDATRGALDALEHVVADREALEAAAGFLSGVVSRVTGGGHPPRWDAAAPDASDPSRVAEAPAGDPTPPVEEIRIA